MSWGIGVRQAKAGPGGDADTNLVRQALEGSTGAYSELVRRYQDRIYSVIAGMVADPEDALDLTQETFIKGYTALSSFRQEAGFYTWLYQIAVNRCIDFSRKRKRRQPPALLEECLQHDPRLEPQDTSPSRDPERAAMNLHLRAAIHAALRKLPEPFRTAVILRDMEGLAQEEIATIMRCPLGTAKTRIHRGRALLRDALRPFVQPDA
jgi:RNA polymerase sigma-70 factor (ECF subfamily)